MAEVASAYVSLLPSAKGFGRQLDSQISGDLDKSGRSGGKRFGSAFGNSLKSVIGPAVAIVGAAVVGGFLKGAVGQASDLNETLSKSNVIFGDNAADIERFGNSAAKSLGLSKEQAIAAAAGFGDMFTQIGFSGKEAAKFSKSTVQMAADLGSFNNLETSDVTDRLSAAFRGEYDSLQAVIPNINAARVESEALAKTGKKTAKELTAQEKAAAVLAIVSKDGARAQGDFARTSGGLANQQKILSAQTADLQAKVGSALVPVLAKVASTVNQKVFPAIAGFISGMKDGTGAGGQLASVLRTAGTVLSSVFGFIKSNSTAIGAFAGTVVILVGAIRAWTIVQGLLNIALTANPIGLIVVAIAALVAGVVYAYTRFETFRNIVNAVFAGVRSIVSAAMPYITSLIKGGVDMILGVVKVFKSLFTGDWKGVWDGVKQILRGALTVVKTLARAGLTALVALVKNLGPLLLSAASAAFGKIKDGAQAGWNATKSYVKSIPGKIVDQFGNARNLLSQIGRQIVDGLTAGIRAAAGKVMDAVNAIVDKIPKGIRKRMGIASPSKVTTKLGRFIAEGLVKGISDGQPGLEKTLKRLSKVIADSQQLKKTKKGMSKGQRDRIAAFNRHAKTETKEMQRAVNQQLKALAGLAKKVDVARSKLNDLKGQRASTVQSVGDSVRGELDLNGVRSFKTAASRVSGLAARAKVFAGKLAALLKAGIPAGLVQEIAGYGTVEGSKVADVLLSGSKQQVGQLAKDYAGINTYSQRIGNVVAGGMFDAGIKAQEGILKGLLDDRAIQRSADRLAKKLTKAVRKALGIKSPSRVFQDQVGRYIPAGVVAGIDDGQRALDRRVAGMVNVSQIGKVRPGDFGGGVAASAPQAPIEMKVYPQPQQSEQEIGRAAANRLMWAMT